jgi:parvulin-like peptidyl-prolyl isomerase
MPAMRMPATLMPAMLMRAKFARSALAALWLLSALPGISAALSAQQVADRVVVDRIVARVEDDVILLSDVQQLSRYQFLVDGKSESDAQILDRLIDQWVVRTEAETARFPLPSDADVQRNLAQLKKSFDSPEQYEARKKESGLSDAELRSISSAQLYLTNYLDSRFRPSVQLDPKAVEDFYQKGVVERAKARGQQPPTFEASRDYIQEALIQQGINEEANRWLKESRGRVHVENLLDAGVK